MTSTSRRVFLTVHEAADALRVDARTVYRAISENAFPAVKVRGRYVIPARVVDALADEAVELGRLVDVADYRVVRAPQASPTTGGPR